MPSQLEVGAALQVVFEPREITYHKPFGMNWSVICEPHDHWRVRIAEAYDNSVRVEVSHPAEGEVFKKVYPTFEGNIFLDIATAVPVKDAE